MKSRGREGSAAAPGSILRRRVGRILRETWLAPRHLAQSYIRRSLEQVVHHARGRLLDVGCGRRPHEDLFAGRIDHYVALDWPQPADVAYPDVFGDALRLPFRGGAFETVLATELIEHVPDAGQFLQEVRRVLAAEGTLILTVPFLEGLHEEPRDFFRLTIHGLRQILEEGGFEVIEIRSRGGWWAVVFGSLMSQYLYDLASPTTEAGARRDNYARLALLLPFGTLAQVVGYALDRVWYVPRWTLGYVAVARARG